MKPRDPLRLELKLAKAMRGSITPLRLEELRQLLQRHKLSVALGEIFYLGDHWYVTHAGLLRLAVRGKCRGIKTTLEERYSNPSVNRWVFKAVVHKSDESKVFEGYGDADPSNVSPFVRGAELRIAETRAVNRALRKAYGIGICSVEELGSAHFTESTPEHPQENRHYHNQNGSNNGQPRLRDQLCLLIRDHKLDPTPVKHMPQISAAPQRSAAPAANWLNPLFPIYRLPQKKIETVWSANSILMPNRRPSHEALVPRSPFQTANR